jgi:hypothetical protein
MKLPVFTVAALLLLLSASIAAQDSRSFLLSSTKRVPGALLIFATAFNERLLHELGERGPQDPAFVSKATREYDDENPLGPKERQNGWKYLI